MNVSASSPATLALLTDGNREYEASIERFVTVRGRVGVLLGEQKNILPYFTAGYAAGFVKGGASVSGSSPWYYGEKWL